MKYLALILTALLIFSVGETLFGEQPARLQSRGTDSSPARYVVAYNIGVEQEDILAPEPLCINDFGQVSGRRISRHRPAHFVFWEGKSYPVDVGGSPAGYLYRINNSAQMVGSYFDYPPKPKDGYHWRACLFQLERGEVKRRDFSPQIEKLASSKGLKALSSFAMGINDRGEVVGCFSPTTESARMTPNERYFGYLWQKGDIVFIESSDPEESIFPVSINNDGWVVVNALSGTAAEPQLRSFLWHKPGERINLGTLGGKNTFAVKANNNRQVVGTSQDSEGVWRAFLWEENKMIDLGDPLGISYLPLVERKNSLVFANGINDSGQIVGWATTEDMAWQISFYCTSIQSFSGAGAPHFDDTPFLWEKGNMHNLNQLVSEPKWVLRRAVDINNKGQIVATAARYRPVALMEYGVILNPTEPHGKD
jgi:probable HAF family extracellular repeat protein